MLKKSKQRNNIKKKEQVKFQKAIIKAIKTVYDPEIPVDVYELGLIYEIHIDIKYNIRVIMTLTSPNCPAAEIIPQQIESAIKKVVGVQKVIIEITFDPPYSQDLMSEEAKLSLGFL